MGDGALTQRSDGHPFQRNNITTVSGGDDPYGPFGNTQPGLRPTAAVPYSSYNPVQDWRDYANQPKTGLGDNDRYGPWAPPEPTYVPQQTTSVQDRFQEAYAQQQTMLQFDLDDIRAQYGGDIDGLEKALADLREQQRASMASFGDFRGDIDNIYGDNPVTLDPLADSAVEERVAKVYDDAEGEVWTVLSNIDEKMGPEMAEAASVSLRGLESHIVNELRTTLDSQDNLHLVATEAAEALSALAYADNALDAARSQTMLKAQLDKAIQDQADALAAAKKARDDAIQRAKDKNARDFTFEDPDYDEELLASLYDHFGDIAGLNEHEVDELIAAYMSIEGEFGEGSTFSEAKWSKALNTWNTSYILRNIDVGDNIEEWQAQMEAIARGQAEIQKTDGVTGRPMVDSNGNPVYITPDQASRRLDQFDNWAESEFLDLAKIFQTGDTSGMSHMANKFKALGILTAGQAETMLATGVEYADSFMSRDSDEYQRMRELYSYQRDFNENWDDIANNGFMFNSDQLYVTETGQYAGYVYPVAADTAMSSWGGFGYHDDDWQHVGVDIHAQPGAPAVSPVAGTIVDIGWDQGSMGNFIKIKDQNGAIHVMMHFNQLEDINRGDSIPAGRLVGLVGNTGNASGTGAHIHYEIRSQTTPANYEGRAAIKKGGTYYLDPMPYLYSTGGVQVQDRSKLPTGNYS